MTLYGHDRWDGDGTFSRLARWCILIASSLREWETQLTSFYGDVTCLFIDDNVGWKAVAQSRIEWKSKEDCFACWT